MTLYNYGPTDKELRGSLGWLVEVTKCLANGALLQRASMDARMERNSHKERIKIGLNAQYDQFFGPS